MYIAHRAIYLLMYIARPRLLHSHCTGPRPGTGQGHQAGGPFKLYSLRSRSLAGSDSVTEALARTGRPTQKVFKLGGPRCSGCCTVPDRQRTGPSGRRAIIQSAVTVQACIMLRLTEALARAGRPSQDDFKFGGPSCCSSCTVPGCGHRTGPLGQLSNIQSVTVCGHCPGSLSRAGKDSQNHWRVRARRPSTRYAVYVYHLVYVNIYMNL